MEKRIETQEAKQPLKDSLDKLEAERKQLRAIVNALKSLNLTNEALIIIKGDKVLVIPEKAVRQIEELGKMSLSVEREESEMYYELRAIAVGKDVNENIRVVGEIVLPTEGKVISLYQFRKMSEFGGHIPEKLEMMVQPYAIEILPAYEEKLGKVEGGMVFDIHVHKREQMPSAGDFDIILGERQAVEWLGIMRVGKMKPEEFKFSKELLSAFYSDINDFNWLEKYENAKVAADKIEDRKERMKFMNSFSRDFGISHKAEVLTYKELLERLE